MDIYFWNNPIFKLIMQVLIFIIFIITIIQIFPRRKDYVASIEEWYNAKKKK